MIRPALLAALAALLTAAPCPAHAQPKTPADLELPPSLAPWVGWVMHGHRDALCPELDGGRLCAWPSVLDLELDGEGGRFRLDLYVEQESDVTLPGSEERWPQAVTLDGKPAVVLGGPRMRVEAGRHRIEGSLRWPALPESLQTPAHVGQVKLRIDGREVVSPRHEEGGLLWLAGSATRDDDTQRLDLEVYRRVEDGVPARIVTRLQLAVGGKAREVVIEGALLEGTRPLTLTGSLPARLDPDGSLRVQVAAGEHRVEVTSIAPAPPKELRAPTPEGPWAKREVWVFVADPNLREVEPTGAARIDPARTNLAPDWRDLPTFALKPGEKLGFDTRRRGEAQPPPNALSLERELWLDLDGGGYTVRDVLSGDMRRDWRLDLTAGELGRAAVHGRDQLVTVHDKARGIEVRDESLRVLAEWRLPREGGALPAVGWSNDMGHVSTTLHLPPGWALLGGEGADSISGTLLDEWDLWSFFFVLLVALASYRLAGPVWGVVALLALTVCTHQPDAPEGVWLWLLGSLALTRLPLRGVWSKGARVLLGLSLLGAVLTLVPFTVHQLRFALYPQVRDAFVEPSFAGPGSFGGAESEPAMDMGMVEETMEEEMAESAAPPPAPKGAGGRAGGGGLRKRMALEDMLYDSDALDSLSLGTTRAQKQQELDLDAVVQTGPGVPEWSWNRYSLHFSGPVQQGQSLSLWLVPPGLGRALAVLRVLLAGLLLFGLLRVSRSELQGPGAGATGAAAALALLSSLWVTGVAQAQPTAMPEGGVDPALLSELRQRLTEPAACAPDCLSVSQLEVSVRDGELSLRSEVHAGTVVGYRAPGPVASFTPREVRVDGRPADALARLEDGFLRVRLPSGRHVVELVGPFPASDELTLQLGTPPRHVRVEAPDFEVDGVRADGKAEGSIQLRRRVQSQDGEAEGGTELPPWLLVRRDIEVGTRYRIVTTVERMGRSNAAVLLRFPLLEGESVTQSDMQEEDGAALIRLSPGQEQLIFTTALEPQASLTLRAPKPGAEQPYSVVWALSCGTFYRCTAEGIAPVSRRSGGQYQPVYRPYPGETLTLKLERLAAAEGRSATIDRATLRLEPGQRLTSAHLELSQRSSTGSSLGITLPEGTEVGELEVDGMPRTSQVNGGRLELALEPGSHSIQAELRLARGLATRYVAPRVEVDGELVNVRVEMDVPHDRWLLFARGPDWGPAVLFWGVLLAFVLFALVLSRIPDSPLRAYQWVLLSLGLTQIPVVGSVLVVGWFFAIRARKQRAPRAAWLFNLWQITLVLLTISAAVTLADAVHEGLVVQPEMQVSGGGSNDGRLRWYVDRSQGAFPQPEMISVPLWIYRGLMLAWALWLASQSLRWLRMGWEAFSAGGRWKMLPRKVLGKRDLAAAQPAPAPEPPKAHTPEPSPDESGPGTDSEPDHEDDAER